MSQLAIANHGPDKWTFLAVVDAAVASELSVTAATNRAALLCRGGVIGALEVVVDIFGNATTRTGLSIGQSIETAYPWCPCTATDRARRLPGTFELRINLLVEQGDSCGILSCQQAPAA